MSQFTGMDIAAVRQLANQLNNAASQIRDLLNQTTSSLQNTPWVGPDRERFLSDWQSEHVAQLTRVISGLEEASQRANQNATEQENAASAG